MQIFKFGNGAADGNAAMKDSLGGKGANLAEMCHLGLPVPYGFTIPTAVCVEYLAQPDQESREAFVGNLYDDLVEPALEEIRAKFNHPVLFSVRSGARVSMPGMMDTVLNVGISSVNVDALIHHLGSDVAHDCDQRGRKMFKEVVGYDRPDCLDDQFIACIMAVFDSWNSDRAKHYRKMYKYPESWGTAVTIQMMVFGNANDQSCTGVLFTRDPSIGTNQITGEFLINAQGEDVVAGTVTPHPLSGMQAWNSAVASELLGTVKDLEVHYKDMMDVEFTVESGKLWILQCRVGKRSAQAAFRIAHDMLKERMIKLPVAAKRLTGDQYASLYATVVDRKASPKPVSKGIAAGGSAVQGIAVFSAKAAINCKVPCILVTNETTPNDLAGMEAAVGILTRTGGLTCHAAVVARGMDKTCVVGCTDLEDKGTWWALQGVDIGQGDIITLDGATGEVWVGEGVTLIDGADTTYADAILTCIMEKCPNFFQGSREIDFTAAVLNGTVPAKLWKNGSYMLDCTGTRVFDDPELDNLVSTNMPQLTSRVLGVVRDLALRTPEATVRMVIEKEYIELSKKVLPSNVKVTEDAKTVADAIDGMPVTEAFIDNVIGGADVWEKISKSLNIKKRVGFVMTKIEFAHRYLG